MRSQLRGRGFRRTIAGSALAALLVPLAVVGGAQAAVADDAVPAATEEVTVSGGTLQWGVRHSIRNYLENFGHTEGWVAASDGATYTRGAAAASFPANSGTVNAAQGTASIAFDGTLEMFGFGEDWLYFTDVRLDVADGVAELTVDMIESYNVKERVDDVSIATFDVPAGGLVVEDGQLALTTERGRFSEEVALTHLPSYGGPTYAFPNDYTDPITLSVSVADDTDPGTDPGTDPENPGPGEPGDGETPSTGPYGTSTGTAYADNSASIRVTPGYAIAADGSTEVKVEGFGFDPGPTVAPGTGSGGIYVGLGTMQDFGTPEKWRRSQGGTSGPIGFGDFTYGSPMFVGNQGSGDGDVATAVMDATGYWSFTLTVPGKNIPSFFGDTIDCVALQCGFFSFGAHGAIKAANEAFTPVYFDGQDESGWPDRDDDTPVVVPPITPERPGDPTALPTEASLTAANRGSIAIESTRGNVATVSVGTNRVGTWVGAAIYPGAQFAGWYLVPANGRIGVPLPTGLAAGAHPLAIIDDQSVLAGWDSFTVEGGSTPTTPTEKPDPYGESTGTNPDTGATLTVSPARSLADRDQKVTLSGTGYATSNNGDVFGGAYILFGWVDTMPSAGGSMARGDYLYADGQETYQWMVNYPGNTTEPGAPSIQADGSWTTEFTIYGSEFTTVNGATVDCYEVQCGVFTIGAHGKANAGVEVFTPVYFDADGAGIDPNARPTVPAAAPVQANPNALASQNAGVGVNGGLQALMTSSSDARTVLFGGVLLVSLGLLGAAVLRRQRILHGTHATP
ncbi:HtaA domain-containing protein [Leucobacter rhizosphaerae]|uniref:HtaA domain-containing protein n=1 Tax=Leucobacter rhizosphaerae TaxID=2932245 RepID=A0ABY4FUA6_9MICO|nr:HtaA domain-containing protein [Leucobacter rhizosphaerae]UOQ59883.1 HtaA domain-containing protein [Leucobacter rhizosphaerae]